MNNDLILVGGKTYLKSQVVILQTKTKGSLFKGSQGDGEWKLFDRRYAWEEWFWRPQELYFISNEVITLSSDNKGWFLQIGLLTDIVKDPVLTSKYKYHRIIASTDTDLYVSSNRAQHGFEAIARPSDKFIAKYIASNATITDVLIEYKIYTSEPFEDSYEGDWKTKTSYRLKLAPDNTISIKAITKIGFRKEFDIFINECIKTAPSVEMASAYNKIKQFVEERY